MSRLYYVLSGLNGSVVNQDDFETPIEGFTPEPDPSTGAITFQVKTKVNDDGEGVLSEQVLATFYRDETKQEVVASTTITILENIEADQKVILTLLEPNNVQEGETAFAIIEGVNGYSSGDSVFYEVEPLVGLINSNDFANGFLFQDEVQLNEIQGRIEVRIPIPTVVNEDGEGVQFESFRFNVYEDSTKTNLLSSNILSIVENLERCESTTTTPTVVEGGDVSIDFTLISQNNQRDKIFYRISGTTINSNDVNVPLEGSFNITSVEGVDNIFEGNLSFTTLVNDDGVDVFQENMLVEFFLESNRNVVCDDINILIVKEDFQLSFAEDSPAALIVDQPAKQEGETFNFTFVDPNSEPNDIFYYTVSGDGINRNDFVDSLQGMFMLGSDNFANFSMRTRINTDATPLPEQATMFVYSDLFRQNLVAATTFTILEEPQDPSEGLIVVTPTNTNNRVTEGNSANLRISTENANPGDLLLFDITGEGIDENDFNYSDSNNIRRINHFRGEIRLDRFGGSFLTINTFRNFDEVEDSTGTVSVANRYQETMIINFYRNSFVSNENYAGSLTLTIIDSEADTGETTDDVEERVIVTVNSIR